MITPSTDWTFRRVVWATLVIAGIALGFWLFYRFNQVVFSIVIAVLLGTVLRPVVTWGHGRGIPRMTAAIFVYLLLLTLLIGFLVVFFPMIAEQGGTIAASVPGYLQSLRDWMVNSTNPFLEQLSGFLPANPVITGWTPQSGQEMLNSAGQVLGYVSSLAFFLFQAAAVLLLAFYWTLNGQRTIQAWLTWVPAQRRKSTHELISAMETRLGFFIAGQGVLCLAIGSVSLAAYLIIGLPNPLVLAVMAGVLEAVPMVGPLLGALPAAVVALAIDPGRLFWVIVATLVIQQLENYWLVPRVMRRAVGVNPFVSMLAIFAFSSLFGILGALMAIPLAAIIQLLLDNFVFHPAFMEAQVSPDRDHSSRLRYEVQSLARGLSKQSRLEKTGSDLVVSQMDQVMDEMEAITTGLDDLLAQVQGKVSP